MSTPRPVTHGSTDRVATFGQFSCTETSHAPHTTLGRHAHAYPAITFVLRGAFSEDFGHGRVHLCGPTSVLLKPAGASHSNVYAASGARSFILECTRNATLFDGLERCTPQVGFGSLVPRVLELYDAVRSGAPERHIAAEELAFEIVCRTSSTRQANGARTPQWLPRVSEQLREQCTRPPTLAMLAASVDVHPIYLARVFRRHFGRSVASYALASRLERAMKLLVTSDLALSRVALETGFADQPHFTRRFHRELGMTPGRFRRLARSSVSLS